MSIGAPEVICRNEKRMLQEAVDTLLNNSARAGKALFTAGDRRKLRSLSDMLKGKQGRFRQNLLGKRVDYSGRSVIVVGPTLKIDECGLPKDMAMKLFKPFVIGQLVREELAHNVKTAERMVFDGGKRVWDILEEVIEGKYVLLNRAPTLHRLGIQAFRPRLIEGMAIQLHPLVCTAFNADFDGDQMAVHVPLSDLAQKEARELMSAARNVLKPSAGEPIITPVQDMVLGCYFLTAMHDGYKGHGSVYGSPNEAIMAHEHGAIDLKAKIKVRYPKVDGEEGEYEYIETSVGRLLFQQIVPVEVGLINETLKKGVLSKLISRALDAVGPERTARLADDIKNIGFKYATKSGLSIAMSDILVPEEKKNILEGANAKIQEINDLYMKGWITADERYQHAIRTWSKTKTEVSTVMVKKFTGQERNSITYMIDSGARGNWGQITQLAGMKGLVANPSGRTIELPIQSNLKEGFTILEYFIATHGGRKGKSDTALKTAEAGYLTRRLVDAVQDIVITEDDCHSEIGYDITWADSEKIGEKFEHRVFGRVLNTDVVVGKKVIGKRDEEIDTPMTELFKEHGVEALNVRSVITCQTDGGICQKCYGRDLSDNKIVKLGTPVGIMAAQSIGEPGTQLTMRTFHMGGVAEGADITQGLTRVEEIFEARSPRTPATLSDISGRVKVVHKGGQTTVQIAGEVLDQDIYFIPAGYEVIVKKDDQVKERTVLAKALADKSTLKTLIGGKVAEISGGKIVVKHAEMQERTYDFHAREQLLVKNGDMIHAGQAINAGHYNLQELLEKQGTHSVQSYIIQEVQHIYASQGQTINDKHLEIIARKMFSKVRIVDGGDTTLLAGEVVDISDVRRADIIAQKMVKNAKPATFEQMLLGLTRVSLATESWLAGASFQETIRVLVEAATTGNIDYLKGLKENVIIGRLIPAGETFRTRLDAAKAADAEASKSK
jgi:DNA-directed RNA polymerase subunit beta'